MTLDDLESLRLSGMRPEGFILLSLIGKLPYTDPQILLCYSDTDFTALYGLEIEIFINTNSVDFMLEIVNKILRVDPYTLWIFNIDTGFRTEIVTCGQRLISRYIPDPEMDRFLELTP